MLYVQVSDPLSNFQSIKIRRFLYETIDPVTQSILLKIVGFLFGKIRANLIYIPLQPDTKTFPWFEHSWLHCLLLKGFWIHFTKFLEPKSIIAKFRINPHWHEPSKQEICSSLAPPSGIFCKTQWAWQDVKLHQLMTFFTSKHVDKYSAEKIWSIKDKEIKVSLLMPIWIIKPSGNEDYIWQ